VVGLWNTSNVKVRSYTYDPFGYLLASSGTVTQPLGWKGREYDAETGLYYVRARYYDPTVGRFLSEDPLGVSAGINPYTFADGDPVNFSDPSGMCDEYIAIPYIDDDGVEHINLQKVVCSEAKESDFWAAWWFVWTHYHAVMDGVRYQDQRPVEVGMPWYIAGGGPASAAEGATSVIGRTKDLGNLAKGERSLLDRLTPDLGSAKANWARNSSVLRQEMRRGLPIRDASPGDMGGTFLNAERALLRERGWTFNSATGYWMPPVR
jgi:RHS repeat-associated protein